MYDSVRHSQTDLCLGILSYWGSEITTPARQHENLPKNVAWCEEGQECYLALSRTAISTAKNCFEHDGDVWNIWTVDQLYTQVSVLNR